MRLLAVSRQCNSCVSLTFPFLLRYYINNSKDYRCAGVDANNVGCSLNVLLELADAETLGYQYNIQ